MQLAVCTVCVVRAHSCHQQGRPRFGVLTLKHRLLRQSSTGLACALAMALFFLIIGWGGGSKEWQRTLDYAVICWASLANIQYVSSEEDELHYYEINWEEKGADTELFQTISRISKDGLLNCRWGFKSIVLVSFHHFWLEWITMLFNLKPDPLQNSQGLTMEVLVVAFQSSFSHSAASYIAWKHFASRLIL